MNAIVSLVAPLLVPLFFLGLLGSLLVVIMTTVYDMRDVFKEDAPADSDDL